MPNIRQTQETTEPVGIVISRGTRDEANPRVWAYMWSDGVERAEVVETRRAA